MSVLSSILDWLRMGYPDGVPPRDRIPLLALLRRSLSDDAVAMGADVLIAQAGAGADAVIAEADAHELVEQAFNMRPDNEDIARVSTVLSAHGWELEAE